MSDGTDLSEFENEAVTRRGNSACPMLRAAQARMTPLQLRKFQGALAKPWRRDQITEDDEVVIPHAVVADIVNGWKVTGFPTITDDTVGKHRRGKCSCV